MPCQWVREQKSGWLRTDTSTACQGDTSGTWLQAGTGCGSSVAARLWGVRSGSVHANQPQLTSALIPLYESVHATPCIPPSCSPGPCCTASGILSASQAAKLSTQAYTPISDPGGLPAGISPPGPPTPPPGPPEPPPTAPPGAPRSCLLHLRAPRHRGQIRCSQSQGPGHPQGAPVWRPPTRPACAAARWQNCSAE